jgi:hypothetical protein
MARAQLAIAGHQLRHPTERSRSQLTGDLLLAGSCMSPGYPPATKPTTPGDQPMNTGQYSKADPCHHLDLRADPSTVPEHREPPGCDVE